MIPFAYRAYWRNPYFSENHVFGGCSCGPLRGPDGALYHNHAPRCRLFKTHCFRCETVIGATLGDAIEERPTPADPHNFFIHCHHCSPPQSLGWADSWEGAPCSNCESGIMVDNTFEQPWLACDVCGYED